MGKIEASNARLLSASQKETEQRTVTLDVWEDYMEKTLLLPEPGLRRPVTIFSLPRYLHETNKAMYEPKLVSIGPYYLAKDGPLRTLQEHKLWCARDFLHRKYMHPLTCLLKMSENETKARLCYSEEIKFSSKEFVQMLLLDGCFVLDFIDKHHNANPDTFLNIERNKSTILTDILLFENQIPYFIVHQLFNLANANNTCSASSCQLRDNFFDLLPSKTFWKKPQITCDEIWHLLHFSYLCLVPDPCSSVRREDIKNTGDRELGFYDADKDKYLVMPSATELTEAGVTFRKNNKPQHLFDISFDKKKGVMEIPALLIHDLNCILLANLLAFEQCSYGPEANISHFTSLFDNLIDTEKDVSLLESSGILINMIGSEEETSIFFNQLGKWNVVKDSKEYRELKTKVREYCDSPLHRYRAVLMRDYLTNPWTIISVIAAVVLLVLTFLQTIFTIYSTFK
jgi:Plant protein of unknown function